MPSGKKVKKQRPQRTKRPAGHNQPAVSVVKQRTWRLHGILPALALIIIIGLLVYANTFDAPFVFDDRPNILVNPFIRLTNISIDELKGVLKSREAFRPMANLTFALNYYFHQYDVTGYHIVNLGIHILTAFLVFLITRQTLILCRYEKTWIALPAALLWLVNPVHTQSVTYIVQRMNSLAAMFYLLTMVCYIQGRLLQQQNNGPSLSPVLMFAASALAGIFALVSKEITITLPIMIFLYEWYFPQDLDKDWLRKQARWIIALSVVMAAVALIYLQGDTLAKLASTYAKKNFTLGQRLLTEPGVVLYYLSLLLYPSPDRLQLIYQLSPADSLFRPATTLLSLVSLAGLIAAALVLRRRNRLVSFAIVWFLVNLVIESSIIPLELVFEHRTYLPSVFLFTALTCFLFTKTTVRKALAIICAAITLCGVWTWQRNAVWTDGIILWTDNVMKAPGSTRAHNNLGIAFDNINRREEAESHYRRALELNPRDEHALTNLGITLMNRGRNDLARDYFQQALSIEPYFVKAYNGLGIACFRKGETDQALTYFKKALSLTPYYTEAASNLDQATRTMEKYGQAIARLQQSRRQRPDDQEITVQLAAVCQQAKMKDLAVDLYEQALAMDPVCEKCLEALAGIYWATNRNDRAAQILERQALLYPDRPDIFYNLACVYAKDNQTDKAVENLKKAVDKGFHDLAYIRRDNSLTAIRDTGYFQNLTTARGE